MHKLLNWIKMHQIKLILHTKLQSTVSLNNMLIPEEGKSVLQMFFNLFSSSSVLIPHVNPAGCFPLKCPPALGQLHYDSIMSHPL